MADLVELNSPENEERSVSVERPSPSPKVEIGIKDTYQIDPDRSLTQELLKDFDKLELKYKLKENWLDITGEEERPFDPDFH